MAEDEAVTIHYQVDARRSRFQVQAFAGGLLSAFGHNPTIAIRGLTGDAWIEPDRLESASLRLRIEADSLDVMNKVSAKDRADMMQKMREEVLETHRYPEIIFESAEIAAETLYQGHYRVRVNGNLSLHGVTRNCLIEAQAVVTEDTLRASGQFTLKQTDYGIRLINAAGGTLKVKDELKFSFDIVASRQ